MHKLLAAVGCVADDWSRLIGVHLVGGHQIDQALGILSPFADPVLVLHAVEIAHDRTDLHFAADSLCISQRTSNAQLRAHLIASHVVCRIICCSGRMTMTADELPNDLNTLKAMVLSREAENARLRQIIKELQRPRASQPLPGPCNTPVCPKDAACRAKVVGYTRPFSTILQSFVSWTRNDRIMEQISFANDEYVDEKGKTRFPRQGES